MTKRGTPKHARRVFRGKFFSIYQWRQKLFDGSTAIFEHASRPDATIIIPVTPNGRILMLRQKQPGTQWFSCFPGGIVDAGESPRQGAVRELREETGYRSGSLRRWFIAQPSFRIISRLHVFIAQNCVRVGKPNPDAGERMTIRAVSFREFLRIASREDFRHSTLTIKALRARLDPRAMRALRKKLLGTER